MPPRPLDEAARRRHKRRNLWQSLLLIAGMVLITALCGWVVAGIEGVVWVAGASLGMLALAQGGSPLWLLRMYGARRLDPHRLPEVFEILVWIAKRAGLPRRPELFHVASPVMNAFAVGRPSGSAIALSDGLLRQLSLRELAGVLAHEVSHIRNDDLWIMSLADIASRLTAAMALVGLALAVLNLPLLLLGLDTVSWLLILSLMVAPSLVSLLQLALSRTREYEADLDAAGLTGDPEGLASALVKLERDPVRLWQSLFLPGQGQAEPSLLRTHPPTEERVRRLLDLQQREPPRSFGEVPIRTLPRGFAPPHRRPRWRASGLWY